MTPDEFCVLWLEKKVELQNVHGALGFAFLLSTSKQSSHTHQ
jgi:hypothetical protein